MKMRHIAVGTSAALISLSAIAAESQPPPAASTSAPNAADDTSVIREAQNALRAKGYAATPQGLREFQQAKGLEPNGKLDEQTLAALAVGASASSGATSEPAREQDERDRYQN